MRADEISRRSGRIFRNVLPSNWIDRSQEDQDDYGIDYEIELLDEAGKGTGFIFKVQLKGTEDSVYRYGGEEVVLRNLQVEKATYYLKDLRIPVVLVLVDVVREQVWWDTFQGNARTTSAHDKAAEKGQRTFTVGIPVAQELPATFGQLIRAVERSSEWIAIDRVRRLHPANLVSIAAEQDRLSEVGEMLRAHSDSFRCREIRSLISKGDLVQARNEANRIFDSESESLEIRFAAGFSLISIAVLGESGGTSSKLERLTSDRIELGRRMLRLVRQKRGGIALRLFARFQLRSARLAAVCQEQWALHLNWKLHVETEGDDFSRVIADTARRTVLVDLFREYERCQFLLGRTVQRNAQEYYPKFWGQHCTDIYVYLLTLWARGSNEPADVLIAHLSMTCEYAVRVAALFEQWDDLIDCARQYVALVNLGDAAGVQARAGEASRFLELLPDDSLRERGREGIQESIAHVTKGPREPSIDDEIEVYRQMATAMGVNLDDPHDDVARIVRIGLRDLNPSRALEHCVHLFVAVGNYGLPGRMLRLPTAGSKWLHCTKLDVSLYGLELDHLSERMKLEHCEGCEFHEAHAADWRWSREWQRAQDARHAEFARRTQLF